MYQIAVWLICFFTCFAYADERAWMDKAVENEFVDFEKNGIFLADIDYSETRYHSLGGIRRFKIIDNEVFGPDGSVKVMLTDIVNTWKVPDVDFLYIISDVCIDNCGLPAPLLTGVKRKSGKIKGVVLFEDWFSRLANWDEMAKMTNQAVLNSPWESKKNVLFWRGSGTDQYYTVENWANAPRGALVFLSKKYPHLIDAGFFHMHSFMCADHPAFWKTVGQKNLEPYDVVLGHKYQINLDGSTASYPGLQWKLLMNCVTFKQDSPDDIMWYFGQLQPWVHYIPVKRDLSDLLEKLRWAMRHDQEAKKIGENGRNFALNHLMPEYLKLYCYKILLKYASLQKFTPTIP